MAFVSGRCPNCGGEVQLDESKDKGFCLHCGSPIHIQEAVARLKVELGGNVAVDGINTAKYLKANAQRSFDVGQYNNAVYDWRKAIELNKTDYESYWGIVLCYMAQNPTAKMAGGMRETDDVKNALAYAPPHIRAEYESAMTRHDENTEQIIQRQAEEQRRQAGENARHWKEEGRFNHPRSVGLGGFFILCDLGMLGGVITGFATGRHGAATVTCSTLLVLFTVLAIHFFSKPKK